MEMLVNHLVGTFDAELDEVLHPGGSVLGSEV